VSLVDDGRRVEWILARVMRADWAVALAGDLIEEASRRGRVWLWTSTARTVAAFLWMYMTTPSLLLSTVWNERRLVLVPALALLAVASVVSHLIPERYRAEATVNDSRASAALSEVVGQMPDDVTVELTRRGNDGPDAVTVVFAGAHPAAVTRAIDNFTSVINGRAASATADDAHQFLDAQLEDARARLLDHERRVEEMRRSEGRVSSEAVRDNGTLEHAYKQLLAKREDVLIAMNLERRLTDVVVEANVPVRRVGPNRLQVTSAGALVGLVLGLALVARKARRA
jgi:uncharacterized protein involved in exopolysaccharide biosynthesis